MSDATVTISDADSADHATALAPLVVHWNGQMTNAVAISGCCSSDRRLVTADTKVSVSDATVTTSDEDTTALSATTLSAIGGATTGTVTGPT